MSHFFIKFYFAQIDSDYKYDNSKKYSEGQKYVFEFRDGIIPVFGASRKF